MVHNNRPAVQDVGWHVTKGVTKPQLRITVGMQAAVRYARLGRSYVHVSYNIAEFGGSFQKVLRVFIRRGDNA